MAMVINECPSRPFASLVHPLLSPYLAFGIPQVGDEVLQPSRLLYHRDGLSLPQSSRTGVMLCPLCWVCWLWFLPFCLGDVLCLGFFYARLLVVVAGFGVGFDRVARFVAVPVAVPVAVAVWLLLVLLLLLLRLLLSICFGFWCWLSVILPKNFLCQRHVKIGACRNDSQHRSSARTPIRRKAPRWILVVRADSQPPHHFSLFKTDKSILWRSNIMTARTAQQYETHVIDRTEITHPNTPTVAQHKHTGHYDHDERDNGVVEKDGCCWQGWSKQIGSEGLHTVV